MLPRSLAAVMRSQLRPLECIVVDDGSTDNSAAVAERLGAHLILTGNRLGPARARNLAANDAQGDILLFLDSDVCVHQDTIARIVAHFRLDHSLDAVIGSYDDAPEASSFLSQYRNLLHCFTHRAGREQASTFWSGCGAVRRQAFLAMEGFDESYDRPAIEDIEFGVRLITAGGRIRLDAAIQVKHLKRWTFWNMIRTDIFDRGIPWGRLILRCGSIPDDLNVRWSQRVSVAIAGLLIVFACLGYRVAAAACFLSLIAINASFYEFLRSRRGTLFVASALPIHFLFYICCGISAIAALTLHLFSHFRRMARGLPRFGIPS